MKCLVTGASGFIGRGLSPALREAGCDVLPLSRRGATLPDGTPTHALDLTGKLPADLFADVDVVIHLAGIAHQRARPDEYAALNETATLALARTAAAAGVRRFIYVSSVKAMGNSPFSAPRNEEDVVVPGDAYGRSKWRAERALLRQCRQSSMCLTILRPALVYGAGVKGNLRLLARWARMGLPRPPPGGKRSMIALNDLHALLLSLAGSSVLDTQTFIACSQDYSAREVYDALRLASGASTGRSWLPRWGWRAGTGLYDALGQGEDSFDKLFGTELYDNARVIAQTDWRPRVSLQDCAPSLLSDPA
ncbi:MAG: NAD-dependent epimerase/dehydratase family protein [Halioglobus sp.]